MTRKRYSPQRDLIRCYVKHTTCHPTAEMVYQQLKPEIPGLSRGTVYRNLGQLAEEGEIIRMPFPVERYDGNTEPHPHLVCTICGQVTDLELDYDGAMDQAVSRKYGCQVLRHESFFYGRCCGCLSPAETG